MRYPDSVNVVLICAAIGFAGCNKDAGLQSKPSSAQPPPASQANDDSTDAKQESSGFEGLFTAIVNGFLPDATEQDEQAGWNALETIDKFDKGQNKAFLAFLEGKLDDSLPFARMKAGYHVALIRGDLGVGQENEDLIPLFIDLLSDDDLSVRRKAMIDMDPIVRNSNLGDKLKPLVPVLTEALKEPSMTYHAITYLGDLGPMAKQAIPAIRMAAERDNDKIIDQVSKEAIRKIEGDDK